MTIFTPSLAVSARFRKHMYTSNVKIWMGKQRLVIKSEHGSVQLRNSSRSLVWMRVAGGGGGAVLFCALNLLGGGVLAIITMPSGCSHSPDFVPVGESRGGGCHNAYRLIWYQMMWLYFESWVKLTTNWYLNLYTRVLYYLKGAVLISGWGGVEEKGEEKRAN